MSMQNEELDALKKALKREQKKNEALKAKLAAEKAEKKKAQSLISSKKVKEVLKIMFEDIDL